MIVSDSTQFLTDGEGRKMAVVLPVEEYEELLEDLQDLAVIAERRDEPRVSWEDVKRQLRADGLLHD
jgi:PHD/YefM family antitoxin component YafN of YafNO toxin-antitoxin module